MRVEKAGRTHRVSRTGKKRGEVKDFRERHMIRCTREDRT
jgi:hypothetical protein